MSAMTWKNESTHCAAEPGGRGEHSQTDGDTALKGAPRRLDERTAVSVLDKLKARSVKIIRRSRFKKRKVAVRRTSEDAAVEKRRTSGHDAAEERAVHFDVPTDEEDGRSSYVRQDPFRRSSKFRQPLKRMSRVKGSPPPSYLARIRPIPEDPLERCLAQPNFDQTSDGEEKEEDEEDEEEEERGEKLQPRFLQQNGTAASDGEDESEDSRSEDESYTVLPAVTVRGEKIDKEEEERQEIASNPLATCERETSRHASFKKVYVRRRSSYRTVVRRESVRRASYVRRGSARTRRRSSVVSATTVRRRSSAVPGYVYRRRSVGTRSPYASSPLHHRKKRRITRRPYRRPRKIVVIGDMCSGKTSLISAYCRDKFSDLYVPTILTSCMTDATVLGEKIELVVVEAAGRVDYAKFRQCAYRKMDLVILCYSADNPKSLRAIKDNWVPELMTFAPNVPYILVGTKKDVREEQVLPRQSKIKAVSNPSIAGTTNVCTEDLREFVTTRQGLEAAELIGAKDFIECSAMYRDGTRDVFETAAKIALRQSPRRKKKRTYRAETCTIL